jgi:maltose O-acetyltransferase
MKNSEIKIGKQYQQCLLFVFSNVTIKDNVLIGGNCTIIDNDGHVLNIDKRK